MSAGAFDRDGKYEAGNGTVYRCRPQPETQDLTLASVANSYPAGAVTPGVGTLKISKGKRELGVVPRTVTVRFTADPTGPQGDYLGEGSSLIIPVFDPGVWDDYAEGQIGTYLGTAVVCDRKSPELVN